MPDKKLLYLGVYHDNTGYGNAALNNILACNEFGINVTCRPVRLTNPKQHNNSSVEDLEKKGLNNITHVIQHILPNYFEYKGGIKNIGFFDYETTNFIHTDWVKYCQLMDLIMVPCIQNKYMCINSGISEDKIRVVPHCLNTNDFNNNDKLHIKDVQDRLIFYTIGEFNRRKNLAGLLRSYYSAFTMKDNVLLIVKTDCPGKDKNKVKQEFKQMCDEIKKSIHIYNHDMFYPKILLITDFLSENDLIKLHNTGDIFISLSRGEAWCIPAHEALCAGNPIIASKWGSFPDLLLSDPSYCTLTNLFKCDNETDAGWLIDGQLTPCFGIKESNFYSGSEYWFEPNLYEAINIMRNAYQKWENDNLKHKCSAAQKRGNIFNYGYVGSLINDIMDEK